MIQLTDLLQEMLTLPEQMAQADSLIVERRAKWMPFAAQEPHTLSRDAMLASLNLEQANRHRKVLDARYDAVSRVTDAMLAHGLSAVLDTGEVALGFDEGPPAELDARFGLQPEVDVLSTQGWKAIPYDGTGGGETEDGAEAAQAGGDNQGAPAGNRKRNKGAD